MNAARKRRKARLLKLKSNTSLGPLSQQAALLKKLEETQVIRAQDEQFLTAFMYLKTEDGKRFEEIKLPREHLTQKINEMNANGFWMPSIYCAVYVPPNQITKVLIYPEFQNLFQNKS
jgi:hypothetical protein